MNSTYNGKRYRVCVYEAAGGTWGGFVEDRRYLLGFVHRGSRRTAMLAAAQIVADDATEARA